MAKHRNDISVARPKAKAMLEKPIDITSRMFFDVILAGEVPVEKFGKMKYPDYYLEQKALPFRMLTKRDYLGMLAQLLGDPFILESSRNEARDRFPKHYEELFKKVDQESGWNKGTLKKFILFMDSMTRLADQGIRPVPRDVQNGLKVLAELREHFKVLEAEELAKADSAADLEDGYAAFMAEKLFTYCKRDGMAKPKYMPDELYQQMMALNPEDFATIAPALRELIHNNILMVQEEYEGVFGNLALSAHGFQKESDIVLELINETKEIAKDLRIDLSKRGKSKDDDS